MPTGWAVWMMLCLLLSLVSSILSVQAQSNVSNGFLTPGSFGQQQQQAGNALWTIGEVYKVQWLTTFVSYKLDIWQRGIRPSCGYRLATVHTYDGKTAQTGVQSFNWTAQLYGSNLTFSPIYFFRINPGIERSISSHDFNLTENISASQNATSTGRPAETSVAKTAMAVSTSEANAGTSSAMWTQPPEDGDAEGSELEVHLMIGLGVGVGAGAILIVLAVVFFSIRLSRRRKRERSRRSGRPPPALP